jgi:ribosomal protein S18 acetylase RimI-like enzyme
MIHPLDRPVWSALNGRQSSLARRDADACRFAPEYGPFGAASNASPASWEALRRLAGAEAGLYLVEAEPPRAPPGIPFRFEPECLQMVAESGGPPGAAMPPFPVLDLAEGDAAEMLALATLTRPGPFSTATHKLGAFVGVRQAGRLVAMAGERMKPDGFTEVSAVCTHPEFRGQGYAPGLMRVVMDRIVARGETPFLHVYASNTGAIRVYEALGFRLRRRMAIGVIESS